VTNGSCVRVQSCVVTGNVDLVNQMLSDIVYAPALNFNSAFGAGEIHAAELIDTLVVFSANGDAPGLQAGLVKLWKSMRRTPEESRTSTYSAVEFRVSTALDGDSVDILASQAAVSATRSEVAAERTRAAVAALAADPVGIAAIDELIDAVSALSSSLSASDIHGLLLDSLSWLATLSSASVVGSPLAGEVIVLQVQAVNDPPVLSYAGAVFDAMAIAGDGQSRQILSINPAVTLEDTSLAVPIEMRDVDALSAPGGRPSVSVPGGDRIVLGPLSMDEYINALASPSAVQVARFVSSSAVPEGLVEVELRVQTGYLELGRVTRARF